MTTSLLLLVLLLPLLLVGASIIFFSRTDYQCTGSGDSSPIATGVCIPAPGQFSSVYSSAFLQVHPRTNEYGLKLWKHDSSCSGKPDDVLYNEGDSCYDDQLTPSSSINFRISTPLQPGVCVIDIYWPGIGCAGLLNHYGFPPNECVLPLDSNSTATASYLNFDYCFR